MRSSLHRCLQRHGVSRLPEARARSGLHLVLDQRRLAVRTCDLLAWWPSAPARLLKDRSGAGRSSQPVQRLDHRRHRPGLGAAPDPHHNAVDLQLDAARTRPAPLLRLSLAAGPRRRLRRGHHHRGEDRLRSPVSDVASGVSTPGEELRLPTTRTGPPPRRPTSRSSPPRSATSPRAPPPPSPSEHLHPASDQLKQHIITGHRQHTEPVQLPRNPDPVIRSAAERCRQDDAYDRTTHPCAPVSGWTPPSA